MILLGSSEEKRGKTMNDYEQFIANIKRKTGIDLSQYKEAQMKRRLTSLYEKKGCQSFAEYFHLLNEDMNLLNEFLDRMTINVSEFYRNPGRWKVLEKRILPRLLASNKKLKVWSAGCSTGEEPYTVAMMLSRYIPLTGLSILATDLDENALQKAKRGVYSERSVAEVPTLERQRFFTKEGEFYTVNEKLKRTITFKKLDLLAEPFDTNVDLIICRNVMIYFTEEAKDTLYQKFNAALKPGGVLFVGSTEQIFNPKQYGFETEDTFFYRKIEQ